MKPYVVIFALISFAALMSFSGCYMTFEARQTATSELQALTTYPEQAKVFLRNNNILVFRDGFTLEDNVLKGRHVIFDYQGKPLGSSQEISIDSIIAITRYSETTSESMKFAGFLGTITGVPLTVLAGYCIICPKCCFGSCPTVYAPSKDGYELQAELFSKCISGQLEDNDLDALHVDLPASGDFALKITNEALETHYINKFHLLAVTHPKSTRVFQSDDDTFIQVGGVIPIAAATSSGGNDITEIFQCDDGEYFRSDTKKFLELRAAPVKDWIELRAHTTPGKQKAKVLIKYRNTLLTTVLLYDVVIGSQGIGALEWTRKMNEDRLYASQFKAVYDLFSGISVECWLNGQWTETGKFQDAGPINWKYSVAEVPVDANGNINVRLQFIPDNFMIDYIAIDTSSNTAPVKTEYLTPVTITDYQGNERFELFSLLGQDDDEYLVTNPGDSYTLHYHCVPPADKEISFFIASKGYYNEWIRGNWITQNDPAYTFDLYDVRGTFHRLVDSWSENKDLLEKEFFNSRVPLKEAK